MKKNKQPLEDTIMEVREDNMLSPAADSDPTLRIAHFLKPIANSIEEPPFKFSQFSSSSSSSSVFESKEWPLQIHFIGWLHAQRKWGCWVDKLKLRYESVWKKAGIFEAIMSTKFCIKKNQNLLYGVVEKWCCETNTFVFPFGEATITLEDVMVLGGYPILGDPVFTSLEDQEMKEVEKKLILERKQLTIRNEGHAYTSLWMDIFIDKGSEIEHEAFLATWLSIFVFPHRNMVKSSLFPIAVHLARGNPIALAPAVLASIYNDLRLFKKTIVGLKNYPVGGDRFPLEITLQSPFYLVQIWVWERFRNLQPQPQTMLINQGDPLLFRWHKVKDFKIDNVRLALDSGVDDFLWRPYVRYAGKYGMFYPNDEILLPFKKDLVDKQMLSFVICLRVAELVGFDSIEQYLPHRVAMQFGMDQDVPSDVPRFNETKVIAWKNYCRRISDRNLYFPSRFFEADVTARYAKWWKQSVLGHDNFVMKIVQHKQSASSRKDRACVGKANISSNEVSVPPGFPPNLVDTLVFGKFCDNGSKTKTRNVDDFYVDVPYENAVHNCLKSDENIVADVEDCKPVLEEYKCGGKLHESKHLLDQYCSVSSTYYEKILPLKRPVSVDNIELSIESMEEVFEDANGSKEARMSGDRVCLYETQAECKSKSFSIRKKASSSNKVTVAQHHLQFHSDMAAQAEAKDSVEERERKESNHEVVVFLKEQYLKNQEELKRLARQQEEMLQLMNLREKRDEELRQLLTSILRNNQQLPSSAS